MTEYDLSSLKCPHCLITGKVAADTLGPIFLGIICLNCHKSITNKYAGVPDNTLTISGDHVE